jgi:hypothetical protein
MKSDGGKMVGNLQGNSNQNRFLVRNDLETGM